MLSWLEFCCVSSNSQLLATVLQQMTVVAAVATEQKAFGMAPSNANIEIPARGKAANPPEGSISRHTNAQLSSQNEQIRGKQKIVNIVQMTSLWFRVDAKVLFASFFCMAVAFPSTSSYQIDTSVDVAPPRLTDQLATLIADESDCNALLANKGSVWNDNKQMMQIRNSIRNWKQRVHQK